MSNSFKLNNYQPQMLGLVLLNVKSVFRFLFSAIPCSFLFFPSNIYHLKKIMKLHHIVMRENFYEAT